MGAPTEEARVDATFQAYLRQLRAHRAELRDSLTALDEALAAPVGRPEAWAQRVHAALVELSHDFEQHVALTEAEGGLYADVRRTAPRLAGQVRRLTDEHVRFAGHIAGLLARMEDPQAVEDPIALREEVTTLIGQLVRHRQSGADLVFEAYELDLGGSG